MLRKIGRKISNLVFDWNLGASGELLFPLLTIAAISQASAFPRRA
jgi:hypothetical protein